MSIDPKPGDIVHVRLEVISRHGNAVAVSWPEHDIKIALCPMSDIIHVEPRPLKVGSKVRTTYSQADVGEVRGVVDDQIIARFGTIYVAYERHELERVDD